MAVRDMKNGKAVGPDGIPVKVWKVLEEDGIKWLILFFDKLLQEESIADECVSVEEQQMPYSRCASYVKSIDMSIRTCIWCNVDLKKAYDRVPRKVLWSEAGVTDKFSVAVCLHQGSALSPYLFLLVIDASTSAIQEEVPWCMLFADDIVLVGKHALEVHTNTEDDDKI
ncbi:PREDICTED: uncharacterized protein LOC106101656 [Papilio polytes]|uniref:uncharacterized protein LOC106101656 n=1 Tax=Papilio polytes TaxID=76194 RepID=UPI000675E120|nr:PREDICTED: uncharacterized protein LOC106101656 [Papilio polytes]